LSGGLIFVPSWDSLEDQWGDQMNHGEDTREFFTLLMYKVSFYTTYTEKKGFVTAKKLGTRNIYFSFFAATKNFAAANKRFVGRTKHFVVTKYFCCLYLKKMIFGITKPFKPCICLSHSSQAERE